jgi:hypothetical protein
MLLMCTSLNTTRLHLRRRRVSSWSGTLLSFSSHLNQGWELGAPLRPPSWTMDCQGGVRESLHLPFMPAIFPTGIHPTAAIHMINS